VVDTLAVIANSLATSRAGPLESIDDESAAHDCSAHPQTLTISAIGTEGADCNGENEKAISKRENRP
jgi:hypothetical protein